MAQENNSFGVPGGGLRIKSVLLTSEDGENLKTSYTYNKPYIDPSGDISFYHELDYGGGNKDFAVSTHPFQKTNIYVNSPANCGVWYSQVVVETAGRGKILHQFPKNEMNSETSFGYQSINRLPLATYYFDDSSKLIKIEKRKYHLNSNYITHLSTGSFSDANNYFSDANINIELTELNQIKAYPYYMDMTRIENDFLSKNQADTLFHLGNAFKHVEVRHNPYYDIYIQNYAPRANLVLPDQDYKIYVGDKKLLLEKEEVLLQGITIADIYNIPYDIDEQNTGNIISKVKTIYHYDNSNHFNPTRIEVVDSKGNSLYQKIKYSREYSLAVDHPVSKLVAQNKLNIPVENQKWIKKTDGNYYLSGAQLTKFKTVNNTDGDEFVVAASSYIMETSAPQLKSLQELSNCSYTDYFEGDSSVYKQKTVLDYTIEDSVISLTNKRFINGLTETNIKNTLKEI